MSVPVIDPSTCIPHNYHPRNGLRDDMTRNLREYLDPPLIEDLTETGFSPNVPIDFYRMGLSISADNARQIGGERWTF